MALRKIYYVIIPLLIITVISEIIPFSISLLFLLPLLFKSSRHTVSIFLMMYGGVFGGVVRTAFPIIPVYGVLLQFFGMVLAWDIIYDLLKRHLKTVFLVITTLLIFGVYFAMGPMDGFATEKYVSMIIMAFVSLFGYYTLCCSSKIDAESLMQILMVSGICLFSFVINTYSLSSEGIFDFNWFRRQTTQMGRTEDLLIDHQQIAMLIVYGFAIFLSQTRLKLSLLLFYSLCSFLLVMTSGCRQGMISILLLIAVRVFLFRPENKGRSKTITKVFWISFGVIVSYYVIFFILTHISSEMMTKAIEGDDERTVLMLSALNLFESNPVFGVGLGGYQSITGFVYPHNMILEIMCECGIVGVIVFGLLLIVPFVKSKIRLNILTNSKLFFNVILLALLLRVMVSADFKESISLFSAVYAIAAVSGKSHTRKIIKRDY